MSSAPTVSAIIPVYNGARYLRQAVQSILDQTFTDFELIVVDDGSTDDSPRILRDLTRIDSRMRVITRPNTGVSGAANDGIAAARGNFLARMDSDDISLPTRFEKQVAYLRAHPEVVLLGTRVLLIDPYGSPLHEGDQQIEHEAIEKEMLKGFGWVVAHPTSMIPVAAFKAEGGYRTDRVPSEDLDLFLRLAEIGRVANLPEVLLHYRQHPQSANHTRFEEQNALKRAILTEAHARRGIALPADWIPPRRNVLSIEEETNLWAWKALKSGHLSAARKHALNLMRMKPLSRESWRLMFCAIRGR
jgi:glycosyltransferase involved in cell wall biosynthesis